MKKFLCSAMASGTGVVLGWCVATAAAADSPLVDPPQSIVVTPAYLNRLSEELRTRHPALEAARARTDAAIAGAQEVRAWEDPAVRVGGMFAEADMRAEDGDILYGIEQRLPLFGKPGLARKVAEAEASRQQADADYQFQLRRRDLEALARIGAQPLLPEPSPSRIP